MRDKVLVVWEGTCSLHLMFEIPVNHYKEKAAGGKLKFLYPPMQSIKFLLRKLLFTIITIILFSMRQKASLNKESFFGFDLEF